MMNQDFKIGYGNKNLPEASDMLSKRPELSQEQENIKSNRVVNALLCSRIECRDRIEGNNRGS